jgi:CelD/BcsL family acetyltransferase involved in cellulose biosynthesis
MNMNVFTTAQSSEWMKALEKCRHDFYHGPEYHAVAERSGEGKALLFHYAEGEYSIALPLLIRSLDGIPGVQPGRDWQDATSVYGYAGPVASHAAVPEPVLRNFQEGLREQLLDMKIVTIFSRLHPILTQQSILAGLGECWTLSQTVSIDLTLPVEAQRIAYRSSLKTALNKLRRNGVTCVHDREGAHLDTFIEIYHETMRRVGAASIYFFPREYFETLFHTLGDRFHLAFCLSEGKIVCGGIFIEGGDVLQYHLGGTRNEALEFAPMKLLLDDVRIWASGRNLKVFHLGGGATSKADDPLLHFKLGYSDRVHDFAVWRWVLDSVAHQELCGERLQWMEANGVPAANPDFFPQYRLPVIQPASLASPLCAMSRVAPAQELHA